MKISNRLQRSEPGWYKVNNRKAQHERGETSQSEADVYIYAEIGDSWFGDAVSAAQFAKDVAGLDVDRINLHINSPGGDAYDGIAIANVIRQHKAHVTTIVDGVAASAASFIAVAGDEVLMAQNAELMIHDGWGLCMGNSETMTEMAGRLDRVSDNIAAMYAGKAGGDVADWRTAMRAETWFSAEEAVKAGLADRMLVTDKADTEKAKNKFDLTIFNHAGRTNAPAPSLSVMWAFAKPDQRDQTSQQASPAEPVRNNNPSTEGADLMSDTLTSGLRERLGIDPDAELDEDGLLAALDDKLTEQPEPQNRAPELPPGTVMIEQDVLDGLRASAELGRQAREQQLTAERNSLVEAAIADGRIAPSRRDHWIKALVADPGSSEVLASLAPGTVPLVSVGYTGGPDEHSDDDAYPANWKL